MSPSDTGLSQRGYPTDISGSEYLQEPLYGEIVRQAIRLGYTIVAYDSDANPTANRETEQAKNIYKAVFAKDPQARLFIHAGYSHIDKAPGNLGDDIKPMAMQLKKLSGFDPLTVDQTQFRQIAIGMIDFGTYSTLAQRFSPEVPVVLRNTDTGEIWSANLLQHDMSVILPPARAQDMKSESQLDMDVSRREAHLSTNAYEADVRPSWLSLDGQRIALRIDTELCEQQVPCVIDAHYPGEPDNAVPADRYTFLHAHSGNVLYLYPGHYRLRAWRSDGSTVGAARGRRQKAAIRRLRNLNYMCSLRLNYMCNPQGARSCRKRIFPLATPKVGSWMRCGATRRLARNRLLPRSRQPATGTRKPSAPCSIAWSPKERSMQRARAGVISIRRCLTRAQWQSQESRSLLDRVFGGRVAPLLAHFSQHEKLSEKDIAELRKLVDTIDRKER